MSRSVLFVLVVSLAATAQQDSPAIPNFHDLTVKTRVTRGLSAPSVTVLQLKGARERMETRPDSPGIAGSFFTRITQCDQQTHLMLYSTQKTYRRDSFHMPPVPHSSGSSGVANVTYVPTRSIGPADGALVTVKYESVDTGDRRQIGGYVAHRVKTTITVDPSKDAAAKKSKTKIDGWYLDIPGYGCDHPPSDPRVQYTGGWHLPMRPGGRDHFVLKYEGTRPSGYPVDEVSTEKSDGNTIINKTELIEASEAPLDDALFDVPADYTLAPDVHNNVLHLVPSTAPQLPQ